MTAKMTQQSINVLQALQNLGREERFWVLESACNGLETPMQEKVMETVIRHLEPDQQERVFQSLGVVRLPSFQPQAAPTYDSAKALLLDATNLSAADKALVAGFAICDLYELEEFSGRQLTEFLKETGNELGNVTAAMTALAQKGWAEIAAKDGDTPQSQKRYALTAAGHTKVRSLIQKLAEKGGSLKRPTTKAALSFDES